MRLDLHLHTTCSDGARTPEEAVELAVRGGLDAMAVTDHDVTRGVAPAQRAARGRIRVIPALEMSSRWRGDSVHVLGYCVDPDAPELAEHERLLRERRRERMGRMVEALAAQGVRLPMEAVARQRASNLVPYTRPHLARALVQAGHADSMRDAFDRFIGGRRPANVAVESPPPEEAIAAIRAAGGIAVWAHPRLRHLPDLLPRMAEAGLGGLEVYRPWPGWMRGRVAAAARDAGLMATGGSDWHGRDDDPPLGEFFVRGAEVREFLEAAGL